MQVQARILQQKLNPSMKSYLRVQMKKPTALDTMVSDAGELEMELTSVLGKADKWQLQADEFQKLVMGLAEPFFNQYEAIHVSLQVGVMPVVPELKSNAPAIIATIDATSGIMREWHAPAGETLLTDTVSMGATILCQPMVAENRPDPSDVRAQGMGADHTIYPVSDTQGQRIRLGETIMPPRPLPPAAIPASRPAVSMPRMESDTQAIG